jgi:hypothetical protein
MRTKLLIAILCAFVLCFLLAASKTAKTPAPASNKVPNTGGNTVQNAQPGGTTKAQSDDGQLLVRRAESAMQRHYTVWAQVTQKAFLLGTEVTGSGSYSEQRSNQGLRFRLELKVQTSDDKLASGLLQVGDGHYLWNYRKLRGTESLSCVDLAAVQQRLDETGAAPTVRVLDAWPGMGGLPKLFRSLDSAFLFDKPEDAELQGNFPVWKVGGRWRPEMLARAVPAHKDAIEQGRGVALEDLPEHLPNRVVLFLGKEDLFPYSVRYYRLDGNTSEVKASPSDIPTVRINMTNVRFNQPIHAAQFVYEPSLKCTDQTEQMLARLGLK